MSRAEMSHFARSKETVPVSFDRWISVFEKLLKNKDERLVNECRLCFEVTKNIDMHLCPRLCDGCGVYDQNVSGKFCAHCSQTSVC